MGDCSDETRSASTVPKVPYLATHHSFHKGLILITFISLGDIVDSLRRIDDNASFRLRFRKINIKSRGKKMR